MRGIIKYFIENPVLVNLGLTIIVFTGAWQLSLIKTNNVPASKIRTLSVSVVYPGASPQEVEEGVVIKIEENLEGVQGIKQFTSESKENQGTITIELWERADPDVVLDEVKNAVEKINSFPRNMEQPIIIKVEPVERVIDLLLVGNAPLQVLKDYAEKMKDDLIRNDGFSQVTIAGYPEEEIEISIRDNSLTRYNLTFDEVVQAIQDANLETTGGEIKNKERNVQIRARSQSYYAKDLKNIIVRAREDGRVVYLKDVATIQDRFADSPVLRRYSGQPSVSIEISGLPEENILDISEITYSYIEEFNQRQEGIQCIVLSDRTQNILDTRNTMMVSVLIGLILVLIVLGLFLEKHLAFWVSLKIPVAMLGMFALSPIYGITINMVSLFGCILVLGILVDDGVVIAENIYQHFKEKDKKPANAALEGTLEVIMPVLFSLMTTATAFSLFFFLPGQVGDFFSTVSFVVSVTLMVAIIESFFFLPAHLAHSKALSRDNRQSKIERKFNESLATFRDKIYMPLVHFAIGKRNGWVLVAFTLLFAGSLLMITSGKVKLTFFPNLNQDTVLATLELEPGTSEHLTLQKLQYIEAAVWRTNDKLSAKRNDGKQVIQHVEISVGPGSHKGQVKVIMLGGEERGIRSSVMTGYLRDETGEVTGATSLSFSGEGGRLGGKPVSVALYSSDVDALRAAKDELKNILLERDDLKDVVDTDETGLPEINVALKPKAGFLGLSLQQVMEQVRSGFFGVEAQSLQRGDEEIKIWVRYGNEHRQTSEDLRQMLIRAGDGNTYRLEDIAYFEQQEGVVAIHRLNGRREIRVEADVAHDQVSALGVVNEIRDEIMPPILARFPGVSQSLEGQNKESTEIIEAMLSIAPLIGLTMLALIIINFKSLSQTLVVLATLPLVLPGIVLGHFIHGVSISIFSLIGTIALIGVIVNDSLVLVTAFNQELARGTPFFEALTRTTRSRFRPILLTTVTTVAGLSPMIATKSVTAGFLVPPAISIAYGLGVGMALPLVLLPALLVLNSQLKTAWYRLWEGKPIEREQLEPAVRALKHRVY